MKIATKRERVRAETLHRREALTSEERTRLSQRIVDATVHWIQRERFDSVMLYLNMRSEVETTVLLEGLLNSGKTGLCACCGYRTTRTYTETDSESENRISPPPLRHVGTGRSMLNLSNRTPSAHCCSRYRFRS